jgi:putative ATP-binding cassette transporter
MQFIFSIIKPVYKILTLSTLIGIIAGISNSSLLAMLNHAISEFQQHKQTHGIIYFSLVLVVFLTETLSQILFSYLSQNVVFNLQTRMCKHILAAPLRELEKIGAPKLLAVLTQDIGNLGMAAILLPTLLINCIIVLACFIYLYQLTPTLFFAVAAFMLVGVIAFLLVDMKSMKNRFMQAREAADALLKCFQAITQGTKELKLNRNRRKAFFDEQLQVAADKYRLETTTAMKIYSIVQSGWKCNFFILIGFIIFILPQFLTLNITLISHAILIIIFLISPLSTLLMLFPTFRRTLTAITKIKSLNLNFTEPVEANNHNLHLLEKHNWQSLVLKDIRHSYYKENSAEKFELGPINLTLHPGEIVFIVGENGSGKSTLAKIITGLYLPESGCIHFANVVINKSNIAWYCEHFSTVFSDYYLFDQLLGLAKTNLDGRAAEYLHKLQLDHKVKVKEGVFSTIDLSDGQRRRLALLAAYLEERPLYVFDEWASNQDPVFKDVFYSQLVPELRRSNRCVVVISHDDRYFHLADKILALKDGHVKIVRGAEK